MTENIEYSAFNHFFQSNATKWGIGEVMLRSADPGDTSWAIEKSHVENLTNIDKGEILLVDELGNPYNTLSNPNEVFGSIEGGTSSLSTLFQRKQAGRLRRFADKFTAYTREEKVLGLFNDVKSLIDYSLSSQELPSLTNSIILSESLGTPGNFLMQFIREVQEGKRLIPFFRANLTNSKDGIRYTGDYRLNIDTENKKIILIPFRWEVCHLNEDNTDNVIENYRYIV